MLDLLVAFLLGPAVLAIELGYFIGLMEGATDPVRMVVATLGTAAYVALIGKGI